MSLPTLLNHPPNQSRELQSSSFARPDFSNHVSVFSYSDPSSFNGDKNYPPPPAQFSFSSPNQELHYVNVGFANQSAQVQNSRPLPSQSPPVNLLPKLPSPPTPTKDLTNSYSSPVPPNYLFSQSSQRSVQSNNQQSPRPANYYQSLPSPPTPTKELLTHSSFTNQAPNYLNIRPNPAQSPPINLNPSKTSPTRETNINYSNQLPNFNGTRPSPAQSPPINFNHSPPAASNEFNSYVNVEYTNQTPNFSYSQPLSNTAIQDNRPSPARSPPVNVPSSPHSPPNPTSPSAQHSPNGSIDHQSDKLPPSLPSPLTKELQTSSITNTFLKGILSSIDSKDPVVANAWLETILDAIDLLPQDVIRQEVVLIAVSKAKAEQNISSKKSACRLLGKISCKLDSQTIKQEILPSVLSLFKDPEGAVRHCICQQLHFVARGIGAVDVEVILLPQLIELSSDENSKVRLACLESMVQLLGYFNSKTCTGTVVPLVIKICEKAKQEEEETLPKIAHHLGRICHGISSYLSLEQKDWFTDYYNHLARIGLPPSPVSTPTKTGKSESQPMPDLLPQLEMERSDLHAECRLQCAYNFPAMILFSGPENFVKTLYPIFATLAADPTWRVRCTLAKGLHEVAKLVNTGFNVTKMEICGLFADSHIEVLEAMVANMVHVIDALARHGVLLFAGQGGQYSQGLSRALLNCEETISLTRNWRLQADCLEKFSCLANCISPVTIMQKFIPLLFSRMLQARTLPCRVAAARTVLVILRFTVKEENRSQIIARIRQDLGGGKSCRTRMLFLLLCEMAISLFSKQYFKQNFFTEILLLAQDKVANIRLKLCGILPRLKSVLSLPSDHVLLQQLEDTVEKLVLAEKDRDVLQAVQKSIHDLVPKKSFIINNYLL